MCYNIYTRTKQQTKERTENTMNKGGFSWKTFFGITAAKRNFARKTGIPTSKSGLEAKIGRTVLNLLFGKK